MRGAISAPQAEGTSSIVPPLARTTLVEGRLRRPCTAGGIASTLSIGVAEEQAQNRLDQLLHRADAALYSAKQRRAAGRNYRSVIALQCCLHIVDAAGSAWRAVTTGRGIFPRLKSRRRPASGGLTSKSAPLLRGIDGPAVGGSVRSNLAEEAMKGGVLNRHGLLAIALAVAVGMGPVTVFQRGSARAATQSVPAVTFGTDAAPMGTVLPDFSAMVQKYGPAVVNITVTKKMPNADADADNPFGPNSPFAPFFRGFPQFPPQRAQPAPVQGEGSGFITRSDGLILTNAHVVQGASEVTVFLTDHREYSAKVLGSDVRSDVAVIKIEAQNLPTVKLGDSRTLRVGEWVLAIGAPFGFENSATQGIVSAEGRTLPESGYVPFIQTDVPINPGNSGGPLFNMQGEVVGINSQIYSRTGGYMGLSFSIPIDVALTVAQQLETTGHVTRGKLGAVIQSVSQSLADSFGLPQPEGALVSSVEKEGPADRAGIQPGDVILKVNGQPVQNSTELPVTIASLAPGTTVNLEIWRNHITRTVSVRLGSMEGVRAAGRSGEPAQGGGKLGLAVRPLTPDEQHEAKTHEGLLVEGATGAAAEAGIQPGDIVLAANGAPVSTSEDLRKAGERSTGHVALLVQRGEMRIFIAVRLG
jgi:serine protease Do